MGHSSFEDAQSDYQMETIMDVLITRARQLKAEKEELRRLALERWQNHWRTRLARRLRAWAEWVELPEPDRVT